MHFQLKKFHFTKKITAVTLTVAIMFTTIFSVSVFVNAASSFSPRLSGPASSNAYYYSSKNIFYATGYGMPNCTAYAFGRAYEILKTEPKLCHFDAQQWYDYNKNNGYYKYGKTAKLGAVACWSYSGGGHVAVVEKIENGTITFSNSAYRGTSFYTTTASVNDSSAGESQWNFQGYIYIGDFSSQTTTTSPVSYKAGVYKVNVDDVLNIRSGMGTSYSIVGSISNGTKITVTQVKSDGSRYWGYTTYNGKSGWVAMDYCTYYSEIPTSAQPATAKPTTQPTTQAATTATQIDYGMGDVNFDGKIDIDDASLIQKYLSKRITFSALQIKNSDFDFNGKVTVADITYMQKYLSQSW